MENCKNCTQPLSEKTGIFSSSNIQKELPNEVFDILKKFSEHTQNSFCEKCLESVMYKASLNCDTKIKEQAKLIENFQNNIPIYSVQNLPNWNYKILSIVTGQSTMGTGFLTEFKSSWGDFIGVDSKSMNLKITEGETKCYKQMRAKTLALGGNAIIGVDIDYAEMGGMKAMVMVCTAGTAIKVENFEIFSQEFCEMNDHIETNKLEYSNLKKDNETLLKFTTLR